MDNTALKAAVAGRGFSRLVAADQQQVVNDAVHELDAMEPRWPYLLTTTTGTLPLVTTDLLEVSQVVNTTTNLPVDYQDYEDLSAFAGSLTQTAADPSYWYFTPGSTTSISGFPVTTRTVRVVYWKTSPDLSAGADTPLAPTRWHHLLVDMAVRNAHVLKGVDIPVSLELTITRKQMEMRTDLLYRQTAGYAQVMPSGWDDF
jgi:hypothetical protein